MRKRCVFDPPGHCLKAVHRARRHPNLLTYDRPQFWFFGVNESRPVAGAAVLCYLEIARNLGAIPSKVLFRSLHCLFAAARG